MKKSKLFWIMGIAYLIDRIFYPDKYKKKEAELTMELKYTPGPEYQPIKFASPKDILCPYCNFRFEELPKRSRKCPQCQKYFYRIKDYECKEYRLITKDEHDEDMRELAVEHSENSDNTELERLRRYHDAGIEKVQVSTSMDEAVCPACKKLQGKVYLIEEALKVMPIPCKNCTHQLHGEAATAGWCRCVYIPVID